MMFVVLSSVNIMVFCPLFLYLKQAAVSQFVPLGHCDLLLNITKAVRRASDMKQGQDTLIKHEAAPLCWLMEFHPVTTNTHRKMLQLWSLVFKMSRRIRSCGHGVMIQKLFGWGGNLFLQQSQFICGKMFKNLEENVKY